MLNHIVIMGRMVRDPELRKTGNGTSVASFTVAVDRDIAPKDGKRETDFIECVAWRQLADMVTKYFKQGSMCVVPGRLQIRSWTDKDGNKRRTAEIVADWVYFGESKKQSASQQAESAGYTNPPAMDGSGYAGMQGNEAIPGDYDYIDGEDGQLPF